MAIIGGEHAMRDETTRDLAKLGLGVTRCRNFYQFVASSVLSLISSSKRWHSRSLLRSSKVSGLPDFTFGHGANLQKNCKLSIQTTKKRFKQSHKRLVM